MIVKDIIPGDAVEDQDEEDDDHGTPIHFGDESFFI
jgi:hypothetical protein